MAVEIGEYKGKPVISLTEEGMHGHHPFSFGLRKAQLILDHIEDIEAFVTEQENLKSMEEK